MKANKISLLLGLLCTILSACSSNKEYKIIISPGATPAEILASKEIRRYIYLRTDKLLPISQTNSPVKTGNCIIISNKDQEILKKYENLPASFYTDLQEQEFILNICSGRKPGITLHYRRRPCRSSLWCLSVCRKDGHTVLPSWRCNT